MNISIYSILYPLAYAFLVSKLIKHICGNNGMLGIARFRILSIAPYLHTNCGDICLQFLHHFFKDCLELITELL